MYRGMHNIMHSEMHHGQRSMDELPATRCLMLISLFSCQRCNEQQIPTASKLLRIFLSSKFRVIHSNTVTK